MYATPPTPGNNTGGSSPPPDVPKRRGPWGRVLSVVLAVGALVLVGWAARKVDWPAVLEAVSAYGPALLLMAVGIAAVSHFFYSLYDRMGVAWTGHHLPARRVMQVSFASYVFNLNLGTLVGAMASRFRMYSRLGLDTETIVRVVSLSLVTNWLGYALLGGSVFALGVIQLPDGWAIGTAALRVVGVALWAVVAIYLLLCGLSTRRSFQVRDRVIWLPTWRTACLQLVLSCGHWLTIAGVLYVLLQRQVSYPEVLGVFMIASIAGALAHIPAGLGVLEGVFLALLAPPLAQHTVIAAVLVFRAVYYLLPLLAAVPIYLLSEARTPRAAATSAG
ncbi:MAG: lysylphosphatidylglycerol synthase domain-containing protein [Pseudomonadota bacterium]